jgi:hypothetical protein
MAGLRNNSVEEIKVLFKRFRRIKSVQERSRHLNDLCIELDAFMSKIKKAHENGSDLSPSEKSTLKSLTDRYSSLLRGLSEEFDKFPK